MKKLVSVFLGLLISTSIYSQTGTTCTTSLTLPYEDPSSEILLSQQQISQWYLFTSENTKVGIGLLNKLKAYKLQEQGRDTVEANLELGFGADERDYGVGAQILRNLGVSKIKLISNNPKKRVGLMGYGLEIVHCVPIEIESNPHNESYLMTKRDKMGHSIMK